MNLISKFISVCDVIVVVFITSCVSQVLTDQLGFVESHRLMDGRLLLCTVAVGFAVFALIWDYLYPFPLSRTVLIVCVLSYPFHTTLQLCGGL